VLSVFSFHFPIALLLRFWKVPTKVVPVYQIEAVDWLGLVAGDILV
jgi:hypothetical protein